MTRNAQSTGGSAAWISGIVFIVYLLSPGPVLRLLYGPPGSSPSPEMTSALEIIYVPIIVAADHVPFVSGFYLWYFELWGIE